MRRAAALIGAGLLALAAFAVLRDAPEHPDASAQDAAVAPPRSAPAPPAIPPEHMPPPFADRNVRLPEPGAPTPSETAAFCAEGNWSRLSESDLRPTPGEDGTLGVDADVWNRTLTATRAGIASWMSQCQANGGRVLIVANTTGDWLATYDPREGLRAAR